MSLATSLAPKEDSQENRRFERIGLALPGRYMLHDRREFPCWTIDVSPGGVALQGVVRGQIGERLVAYIRDLGWIEGSVARHFGDNFAVDIRSPASKQERLANTIARLTLRPVNVVSEMRQHERIVADDQTVTLKTPDGKEFLGRLVDVSFPGAAVFVDATPPIGTLVTLGRTAARVVRHFDGGIAVAFGHQFFGELLNEINDLGVMLHRPN